jgi:hypothetical protein
MLATIFKAITVFNFVFCGESRSVKKNAKAGGVGPAAVLRTDLLNPNQGRLIEKKASIA